MNQDSTVPTIDNEELSRIQSLFTNTIPGALLSAKDPCPELVAKTTNCGTNTTKPILISPDIYSSLTTFLSTPTKLPRTNIPTGSTQTSHIFSHKQRTIFLNTLRVKELLESTFISKRDPKHKFSFQIITPDKSFVLFARTKQERDDWMADLCESATPPEIDVPCWVPDVDVSLCPLCSRKFSILIRKHHCRACGSVVCTKCKPICKQIDEDPTKMAEFVANKEIVQVSKQQIISLQYEREPIVQLEKWPVDENSTILVDIGSLYTKYGPIEISKPRKFPSIVSYSYGAHYGTYYSSVGSESVGYDWLNESPTLTFSNDYRISDITLISHISAYAVVKSWVPNEKIVSSMYNKKNEVVLLEGKLGQFRDVKDKFKICSWSFCDGPAIVVDLGHMNVNFYVVDENNKCVTMTTLGFGGKKISSLLETLITHNNKQRIQVQNGYTMNQIKEKCVYVSADLKKSFAEYGYAFDFLHELASDNKTYFHNMPSDILTYMGNFITTKDSTIFEKLGCIPMSKNSIKSDHVMTIGTGPERFVAMEVLFSPFICGYKKSFQGVLKELIGKYSQKKIVLTGGMVACPGLVARLAKELNMDVKLSVDELYSWNCTRNSKNKNM